MPPFQTNPLNPNPIHTLLRKHPSLFGVPFVLIIVGASFGLQQFTQTRYELQDQKVQNVCPLRLLYAAHSAHWNYLLTVGDARAGAWA